MPSGRVVDAEQRMEQSDRNPNQEHDRGRAPGNPSIDRADELRHPGHTPSDEEGRDRPPGNAERKRGPDSPWMGGG
jgi:hypothetical protein